MKSRDTAVRLKRFEAEDLGRKVADLEAMIREFELMAADLDRQIATEEERTGIKDPRHFSYSTFAKAAAQRRDNLRASADDLRPKLELARTAHETALEELAKVESAESRPFDRSGRRRSSRHDALAG